MSNLSLSGAELIALIIGAVLYGIYLVTLGIAGRSLLMTETGQWKRRSAINWVIVVVSAVLFVNGTLNLIVASITVYQAFVLYTGSGGPEHIFTHGSGWQTITKSFNVPFQSLVGDGILIYRCWFLWNKSLLVIALPMLIWLANIACAIRLVDLIAQASQGLIIGSVIQPWGQAFWSMTICISVMVTGLIVARIWLVERQNRRFRVPGIDTVATSREGPSPPKSTLSRAMRNIIESGMIYTVVSIFTLATYTLKSNLHYPASGMEIHSVGITFNLILIRAARIGSASARANGRPDVSAGSVPLQIQITQTQTHPTSPSSEGVFRFSRFHKEEEEGEGEFGRRAEAV
ncbi:hypothetical protein DFH08DRAFT_905135 [Mycena albidolilacea]|uniref:Uncharacterized protein n=1 Tax=Mycena albidolilacea TaxID=1033008 RepID=A0AAD7E877_9AGAR|nr:hypothetical protein DFH08DRAFT_905135 [Mycena albidolilacea]